MEFDVAWSADRYDISFLADYVAAKFLVSEQKVCDENSWDQFSGPRKGNGSVPIASEGS